MPSLKRLPTETIRAWLKWSGTKTFAAFCLLFKYHNRFKYWHIQFKSPNIDRFKLFATRENTWRWKCLRLTYSTSVIILWRWTEIDRSEWYDVKQKTIIKWNKSKVWYWGKFRENFNVILNLTLRVVISIKRIAAVIQFLHVECYIILRMRCNLM